VTDVQQAILAQLGPCIRFHAPQERPAQYQDFQPQTPPVQLVTTARQGHPQQHPLTMLLRQREVTDADLVIIVSLALAGQSLAVLGPTIQTISPQVLLPAFHAKQEHTVALPDSRRQPICVLKATSAQLAHQALDHQLAYVLLVLPAQLAQ
jgi:hypothetical protein